MFIKEFIDKSELVNALDDFEADLSQDGTEIENEICYDIKKKISYLKPADVSPVVHAKIV